MLYRENPAAAAPCGRFGAALRAGLAAAALAALIAPLCTASGEERTSPETAEAVRRAPDPFVITVKDAGSGRGVPLVRLRTVNNIRYVTDRSGKAAIYEPGLMGQDVFLFVVSLSGFQPYPADGFGYRGVRPVLKRGGSMEVELSAAPGTAAGHWPLDDGAGASAADFVGSNDGTLHGAPEWRLGGGITGEAGDHALRFDGADDEMRILRTVKDDFTISFWMRADQPGPAGSQWYHGSGLVDGDAAGVHDDFGVAILGDRAAFGTGNPDVTIVSQSRVDDGAWHHVAAVRGSPGRFALFIDGTLEAAGSGGAQPLDAAPHLVAGSLQTGTNHLAGELDEIRIYDAALTPRDVFALYAEACAGPQAEPHRPFVIKIVDAATGRGVPLVVLRTPQGLRSITDSAGVAAFFEPSLMGREVFFKISSHGYAPPAGGGATLMAAPGQSAVIAIERLNIAERLYRITGQGIYNESAFAGLPMPLEKPLLNGKVMGQDTVFVAEYKGKLHWIYGDTNRPSYPLGNFATSGAVSLPPDAGGLDPSIGVDLTYFVDETGFSKKMMPVPEPGLIWMGGLVALPDGGGGERLVGRFTRLKDLGHPLEHGLAIFNDATETFERLLVWPLDQNVAPDGTAYARGGHVYFCKPYPVIRVPASLAAFQDPDGYEAFSCLAHGTGFSGASSILDRDPGGGLIWAWKSNTAPVDDVQWQQIVDAGLAAPGEAWNWMLDVDSGKHVVNQGGSAAYNAYRGRWIMIFGELYGSASLLGEIWYSEAAAPEGPWTRAKKIITHNDYSFYNVSYHPQFDQAGGRMIYFEGTYTSTFSGNDDPTPRYDYNQVMYRLDLADPRLAGVRSQVPR